MNSFRKFHCFTWFQPHSYQTAIRIAISSASKDHLRQTGSLTAPVTKTTKLSRWIIQSSETMVTPIPWQCDDMQITKGIRSPRFSAGRTHWGLVSGFDFKNNLWFLEIGNPPWAFRHLVHFRMFQQLSRIIVEDLWHLLSRGGSLQGITSKVKQGFGGLILCSCRRVGKHSLYWAALSTG